LRYGINTSPPGGNDRANIAARDNFSVKVFAFEFVYYSKLLLNVVRFIRSLVVAARGRTQRSPERYLENHQIIESECSPGSL